MNMVTQKGDTIYPTYPAQWDEQQWCKCGYRSGWKRVFGKTQEQLLEDEWEQANPENDH